MCATEERLHLPVLCRLSVLIALAVLASAQQTLSPREQLNQYVAQLQAHSDDRGLREKIIKLAQELKPPPVAPREAKEHEGAAEYAFKSAASQGDFAKAAAEYEQALLLAPWVASDYFNLGVAREKAGDLDKAVAAFELYLLAAPNAADADDVVKRIGALKFQARTASDSQAAAERERRAQADAERARQQEEARRQQEQQRLEGRYICHSSSKTTEGSQDDDLIFDVREGQVTLGQIHHRCTGIYAETCRPLEVYKVVWTEPLTGRRFHHDLPYGSWDGTISDDGGSITVVWSQPNGYTEQRIFHRQ